MQTARQWPGRERRKHGKEEEDVKKDEVRPLRAYWSKLDVLMFMNGVHINVYRFCNTWIMYKTAYLDISTEYVLQDLRIQFALPGLNRICATVKTWLVWTFLGWKNHPISWNVIKKICIPWFLYPYCMVLTMAHIIFYIPEFILKVSTVDGYRIPIKSILACGILTYIYIHIIRI